MTGSLAEDDVELLAIARALRTVAVLGIKDASQPDAAAYFISAQLAETGVRVIGINPNLSQALGSPTLASVVDISEAVDVLDVFRSARHIPRHAAELLALPVELRPRVVWLQTGIRHEAAAAKLAASGFRVVQDRCLGVYRRRALGMP